MTRCADVLYRIEAYQADEGIKDVLKKSLLALVGLSSFAPAAKGFPKLSAEEVSAAQDILSRGQSHLELKNWEELRDNGKKMSLEQVMTYIDPATHEEVNLDFGNKLKPGYFSWKEVKLSSNVGLDNLKSFELQALVQRLEDFGASQGLQGPPKLGAAK